MKRLLAVLLTLALGCGLFGCSMMQAKAHVSVFWYQESDVHLTDVRQFLEKKLSAEDLQYDNYYAEGNQSKQIDQIKTAIRKGTDLLIVNQVTAGSLATAIDILTIAGDTPVIFFNRAIGSEKESDVEFFRTHPTACFIGTDAPMAGHMQGELIGQYLVENFEEVDLNGDGKISYAMFKGDNADVSAIFRTRYSVEDANLLLAQAGREELQYFDPGIPMELQYQADLDGNWSAAAAEGYMRENLKRYNEDRGNMIELVIANNDDMALGAVKALQEKGYNSKDSRYIPVFGVDASTAGRKMIAEGTMTGTILQDAEGMAKAIALTASAIADGVRPVEALAGLEDPRFSLSGDSDSRLYVAYAPYTGK